MPAMVTAFGRRSLAIVLLGLTALSAAHGLEQQLGLTFGEAAITQTDGAYQVVLPVGITDAEAVRALLAIINEPEVPDGTVITLNTADGAPLILAAKDDAGRARIEWLGTMPSAGPVFTEPERFVNPIVITLLDRAFGSGSTEWTGRNYSVRPTGSMVDVVRVRELSELMHTYYFPYDVEVTMYGSNREPLVRGGRDASGNVELRSLMPRAPSSGATVSPRSMPPAPDASPASTWGAECTTYEYGNTWGVRCRSW